MNTGAYGVIFDMDGVLVDSYQAHYESWLQTARRWGLEMTEPQFRATFGRTSRDIIARLWGANFTDEQIAEFDQLKEQAYRDGLVHHFPQMPGADELIADLHAEGFRLAVGSSGPKENVRTVLRLLPHGRLIDATVSGGEVRHGKPDPEVFVRAAQKIGVPPAFCAVIEDAVVGVEAARRAGMAALAVTGTASARELAPRAHQVVESLAELTPRLVRSIIDAARGVQE